MSASSASGERRFHLGEEGPVLIPCRLCYRGIELSGEHVEQDSLGRSYYRCPHCHGSFPIRQEDADALLDGLDDA